MQNDMVDSKESKTTSWFKRFIGRKQKPEVTWPFPFVEGRLFILTMRAGIDGYHISVGGRHVTSFPYRTVSCKNKNYLWVHFYCFLLFFKAMFVFLRRYINLLLTCKGFLEISILKKNVFMLCFQGFTLEDATGLAIKGDVDVHSVYATSLPTSHPSFSPQRALEMSEKWRTRSIHVNPIKLFIGVLSASNHFAERMAVRKTWMQSSAIKSSLIVVRFFVALVSLFTFSFLRKWLNVIISFCYIQGSRCY